MNERTEVSGETRRAERAEASAPHLADRPPTPEEEQEAGDEPVDQEVRQRYKEMVERGANQEGEGRIP